MSSVVNKLKRIPVEYDDAAKPDAWRTIGRRLMASAELLWKPLQAAIDGFVATKDDRTPEQTAEYEALAEHYAAFFVLAGFAVENYLKARLLANALKAGHSFPNGEAAMRFVRDLDTPRKAQRKSHDLVALAKAAIVLTPKNEPLLGKLTQYALWAGRYPVPNDRAVLPFPRITRDRDLDDIKALIRDLSR
jgi:hypothetical protein